MRDDVIERVVIDGRVEHRHPLFGSCCHENVRPINPDDPEPDTDNTLLDLLSYHPGRRVRVTVEFLVEDDVHQFGHRRAALSEGARSQ